ncbi:hypothetical protein E0H26_03485 [Micromonospora zingiberis]|uniref:VWA domain-containing protein n=1 Tax=Micromonospora zingiberis TaxID=2053011 RepID=A0A4R0GSL9_9ACTN|nr:hypothetical protein [Micromonospora zingiberis]TCB99633.1 hypothetical protein E0H26_03485 [Micromonospora zingiberis]
MILPPPPRSGHQLVVFLIDATVRDQWPATAMDHVVDMANRSLAAPNHHFAWVVFDTIARALHGWADTVTGRAVTDIVRQLSTDPVTTPSALDAGLAAGYQLSRSFLDQRDDGLPATVDLLAMIGSAGDCRGESHPEVASDSRIQLAVATCGEPGPAPADIDLTRVAGPELGVVWVAARQRMAGRRRPHLVLG